MHRMRQGSLGRLWAGGAVATAVWTAVLYAAPLFGRPPLDLGAMLVGLWLNRLPPVGTALWYLGVLLLWVGGVLVLPLIYRMLAGLFGSWLPSPGWVRGLLWGIALWLLVQTLLLPTVGLGYTSKAPLSIGVLLHGLLGSVLYGMVFTGSLAPAADRA